MRSHKFPKLIVLVASLSLLSCSGVGSQIDNGAPRKIFASSQLNNSDLRTLGGGTTGIRGADTICQQQANGNGAFRTVKAMIVDDIRRRACSTPGCAGGTAEQIDWVLKTNTVYMRPDGTVIGTTDAKGLFTFPLSNAISSTGGTMLTGFSSNADWTSDINNNCSDWESGVGGNNAARGWLNSTTSSVLQSGVHSCSLGQVQLYCVEQ